MAGPITWRNVQGKGEIAAVGFTRGASDSMNKGFGILGGLVDDAQKIADDNTKAVTGNNTQDYLDYISSFRSPEALEAAQQSGAIAQKLDSYAGNIDRATARDAFGNALKDSRGEAIADYQYDQTLLDQQASPLEQTYLGLVNAKKFGEAQAFLDSNAEVLTQAGDLGRLQGALASAQENAVDRSFLGEQRNEQRKAWQEAEKVRLDNELSNNLISSGFAQVAASADPTNLRSESQAIQTYMDQVRKDNPGKAPEFYSKIQNQINQSLADQNGLSLNDQNAKTELMGQLVTDMGVSNNIIVAGREQNPVTEIPAILSRMVGEEKDVANFLNTPGGAEVRQLMFDMASAGKINVKGVGEVEITPMVLELAAKDMEEGWITNPSGADYREAVENYVTTKGYTEQLAKAKEYDAAKSAIDAEFQTVAQRNRLNALRSLYTPQAEAQTPAQTQPQPTQAAPAPVQVPGQAPAPVAGPPGNPYTNAAKLLGQIAVDGVSAVNTAFDNRPKRDLTAAASERMAKVTDAISNNRLWDVSNVYLEEALRSPNLSAADKAKVQDQLIKNIARK